MADSTEPPAPSYRPRSALAEYLKAPVEACQSAIVSVHDTLGIPWWATVVGAGVFARALTLPLSLRAAAAGTNFTQARTAINVSTFRLLGDAGLAECTPALAPHARRLPMLTQRFARKPHSRMWLIAPLVQVSGSACFRSCLFRCYHSIPCTARNKDHVVHSLRCRYLY